MFILKTIPSDTFREFLTHLRKDGAGSSSGIGIQLY